MIDSIPNNIEFIKNELIRWNEFLSVNSKVALLDLNIYSENLIKDILNIMWNQELVNVNMLKSNAKGIDLYDSKSGLSVQVTSQNKKRKIEESFKKYLNEKNSKGYKELKIFILGFKSTRKKKDIILENGEIFNRNNVYYFDDILNYVMYYKDVNDVFKIARLFKLNNDDYTKNEEIKQIYKEIRENKELNEHVIERKIILKSDVLDYDFLIDRNKKNIIDIILNTSKILILGEPGGGKTYFLKHTSDIIKEVGYEIPFYKRINNYVDENIENFIPDKYLNLVQDKIILLLDGLDEIESKSRFVFMKKLNTFSEKYPSIKIIISCRINYFEKSKGVLENYTEYLLADFTEEDIYNYVKSKNIDYDNFMYGVKKNKYNSIIYNPFYLELMINFYILNNKLPEKNKILEEGIKNILDKDRCKYSKTIQDFENVQLNILAFIKKIALIMQVMGKNYLTIEEISKITDLETIKNLECCGLMCLEKKQYTFKHNNYGEYLSAKQLESFSEKQITSLIFQKGTNKIKDNWYNSVSLYIVGNPNKKVFNKIIKYNLNIIYKMESDKISIMKRNKVFHKIIKYHIKKRIWIPKDIVYNDKFLKFYSTDENIKYLCKIINRNQHYVETHNCLEVISGIAKFFSSKILIDTCIKVLKSPDYTKYDKKSALYALANCGYGNEKFIKEIINIFKNTENQYLRTGYFHYINQMNLVDEMINYIYDCINIIKGSRRFNHSKDDELLIDEHIEYSKLFKNIKKEESIKYLIKEFSRKNIRLETGNDYEITNICFSLEKMNLDEKKLNNYLFQLFILFQNKFHIENCKIILNKIDNKGKRVELFKYYLENTKKHRFGNINNIVNEQCGYFFINEYKNSKYDDELCELVLRSLKYNSLAYKELKNIYEKTTKKIIEEPIIKLTRAEEEKVINEIFNSLFIKEEFIKNLEIVFEVSKNKIIKREDVYLLYYDFMDDLKFDYACDFLYRISDKNTEVFELGKLEIIFESYSYEYIMINEIEKMLTQYDYLMPSDKQRKQIEEIIFKWIKDINFRDVLKNTKFISLKYDTKAELVAKLRKKLGLKFSNKILLDMLEFCYVEEGQMSKITSIISELGDEKAKERIIYNIDNRDLRDSVFLNHIEFCIEKNIYKNVNKIYEYYNSSKIGNYEKTKCFEYLIKSKNEEIMFKLIEHLDSIDDDLLANNFYIIKKYISPSIIKRLKLKFNITSNEKFKILCADLLIGSNDYQGIKYYYQWMVKNKTTFSNEINENLSKINGLRNLYILLKIYRLSCNPDFNDSYWSSIKFSIQKSLVLIGNKNRLNGILTIISLYIFKIIYCKNKYNGFINYIISKIDIRKNKISDVLDIDDVIKYLSFLGISL